MSYLEIINNVDDRNSETIKRQFENYCNWCWKHGHGNCSTCKRLYNKVYIPVRKKELKEKLGI